MADKKMNNMSGMSSMPGMNMGDPNQAVHNTDPTKNQHGIDTGPAPSQPAGEVMMPEAMKNMPMAKPIRIWTVTGTEDWSMLRGFGQANSMVTMMNEMMVAGSPMSQMKMGKMNMSMADMPAPTPEEARMASATTAAPAATNEAASSGAVSSDHVTMTVTPNPPHVGANTVNITVTDSDGNPMTGLKLIATVAMTTMDMGTAHPSVMEMGNGHYMTKANFGMAGPWRVTVAGNGINQSTVFSPGAAVPPPTQAPASASGLLTVQASIAPNPPSVASSNLMTVTVTDAAGKPITGATVTSTVVMTTMDMGTTHPAFKSLGDGKYQGKVGFGMSGPWRVTLHVTAPGHKPVIKVFVFQAK